MPQTIITAGDAIGATSLTAGNDGALTVSVGPAGSKVTALSIDAVGTPTFIKQPVLPVQSMVRLTLANGYGSTNTAIRRFTTIVTNQGVDITYADSSTLGATFTVNANGVYAVTYADQFNGPAFIGLSINTTNPTASIDTLSVPEVLDCKYVASANATTGAVGTLYLPAGSVIRAHTNKAVSGTSTAQCQFTITRVA